MICPNCGADIHENTATCPFCGSAFEKGQERKYMQDLEKVRKDTGDLSDYTETTYHRVLRQYARLIIIIAVIIAALIVGGIIAYRINSKYRNASYASDVKDEMAFQEKYFGELDDLYDSGDDEACFNRMTELMDEKGSSALWSWKHYEYYMNYYSLVEEMEYAREAAASGKLDDDTLISAAVDSFDLLYSENANRKIPGLDKQRKQVVEDLRNNAREFLGEDLGLSEEEQKKIAEECSEYGYIRYDKVKKKLPELKEHME